MNNLKFAIDYLVQYNHINNLKNVYSFDTLRALMNITMPYDLTDEYYKAQDNAIKEELQKYQIVDVSKLQFKNNIAIYQGDITKIKVDAIVNACNEKLLGCFYPLHSCVDNIIHSYAGLEVRRDLIAIMDKQGHDEKNGMCKATSAYNLPSKYIFHTVGPKVSKLNDQDINDLKSCYLSCLMEASKLKLQTIAFPCISTGIYSFPADIASNIAYKTVREYLKNDSSLKVIFVTYTNKDYLLYKQEVKKDDN